MKQEVMPETCRYCTKSVSCKNRQEVRFNTFGYALYNVTREEDEKIDKILAKNCKLPRKEVYHG